MTVQDVIEKVKNLHTERADIETFETAYLKDYVWAEVNVVIACPAYVFRIWRDDVPLFSVRVRKIEALEWLMNGFASQHDNPKWDYTVEHPIGGDEYGAF